MSTRLGALILAMLLAACGGPGPAPSPTPTPAPSPTPGAEGFYLRAWLSQALPPQHTLTWLPPLTISEGMAIDGNVAIPMIFPGPLMIVPNVREITPEGQAAIVDLARRLGLLDGQTDFTGSTAMPGSTTAHVLMVIDGSEVELIGDPSATGRCPTGDLRCQPEAATAEAFAWFWARLGYLDDWLEGEVGPTAAYAPERLLVVSTPPTDLDVPAQPVAWPLEAGLPELGEPWIIDGTRCATVEGDELEILLPVLLAANQASVFVDSADEARALLVRVLVPGEPSPCA